MTDASDQGETLVFVYGTLRAGFANHPLLAGARSLGRARTVAAYALFVDRYPYLADEPAVSRVVGEVYAVPPAMLAALDRLEDHPRWYRRRPIAVALDDGAAAVHAEAYFRAQPPPDGERGALVEGGDYATVAGATAVG